MHGLQVLHLPSRLHTKGTLSTISPLCYPTSFDGVPVNRLIMLAKNNAELTFEPHSAPTKCILWDVFWVFPSLPRFPAYLAGTR